MEAVWADFETLYEKKKQPQKSMTSLTVLVVLHEYKWVLKHSFQRYHIEDNADFHKKRNKLPYQDCWDATTQVGSMDS